MPSNNSVGTSNMDHSNDSLHDEVWNKIPRATACMPPSTGDAPEGSSSNPIQLANDLLQTAYTARWNWDGQRDLPEKTKERTQLKLKQAKTAKEWRQAADKLDILEGNHYWKFDEGSNECNMQLIRKRLDRLKQANHDNDIEEMLQQIRNALKRDLGGMCDPRLYQHTWLGTKHLVEEYTDVVKYTIERIAKHCETADSATVDRFLDTMKAARQCFGNTVLMLSGGGTLGMCHIGVVKCLLEAELLPKVVCGASAGSIVASVLCTHKGRELVDKLEELCTGDLSVFQGADEVQGIPGMAIKIFKGEPAFNISNLCRVMKRLLGNITFKEAYNATGMALNIHVSCRDKFNMPRLLNYITAPNVVIWTAVASSCALPCVFEPPGLRAKNPETQELEPWGALDHKWIDGSIEGDLPAQLLERLFNVNNFLASQVNPHIGPFLPKEGSKPGWIRKTFSLSKLNVLWALDGVMDGGLDLFPIKMAHSVLSQKYDGDITLLPDISWVPLHKILANPTPDFMARATREGERATWPKLDRIHNSVAIELSLDRCIKQIHARKVEGLHVRRPLSTTRSERGLAILSARRRSGGSRGVDVIPRFARGRQSLHRPVKSMIEPSQLASALSAAQADPNIPSSSDEARSGQTSPTTEEREFDDDYEEETDASEYDDHDMHPTDLERRMLAFISQPASPSISMKKTFWGNDSPSPRSNTSAPRPPTPPSKSPMMKRAMSGLHMSSIDSAVKLGFTGRKKPPHTSHN